MQEAFNKIQNTILHKDESKEKNYTKVRSTTLIHNLFLSFKRPKTLFLVSSTYRINHFAYRASKGVYQHKVPRVYASVS